MIPHVGLLPLYVELYDRSMPGLIPEVEAQTVLVADALCGVGVRVTTAPVCRLAHEFATAVAQFEREGVDAIVTLHLAYSPSLEVEGVLTSTSLPVIVLDTTPAGSFDENTDPSAMMLNHGIHGVQDMCNRLVRHGKPFEIHAGHLGDPSVLERVRRSAEAAAIVGRLRRMRVGLVERPFDGMGDFQVDATQLRHDLGITVVPARTTTLPAAADVSQAAVDTEMAADRARLDVDPDLSPATHELTTRAGLALRAWMEQQALTAVTVSFRDVGSANPMLPVMPFPECSKIMERGIGYAAEGDVLTAAWMGALLKWAPDTTFTEMFCPDWAGHAVFLSHMGEFNYRVADGKPRLTTLAFPYTDAPDPAVAYGSLKAGDVVLANLAPLGELGYRLTLVPGHIRKVAPHNKLVSLVNGFFVPDTPLTDFLEQFSLRGATHHSALVYGGDDVLPTLRSVGRFLGADTAVI